MTSPGRPASNTGEVIATPAAQLKNKMQLAEAATQLAMSFELIQHETGTYMPADWETGKSNPLPPPESRTWQLLSSDDKMLLGRAESNILFANDSEIRNFELMLRQSAKRISTRPKSVLIRTPDGLKVLGESGTLEDPDGNFVPNTIKPLLNENPDDKDKVFKTISGWLDSDEEADSLLYHFASALAPGWSAVKYVLLLGEGRNGKSLMLSMLTDLFGAENVSNVTRQNMAAQDPTCIDLNGRLLNVIFDGQMEYIKESGPEKTLIAGEPGYVRRLFESSKTKVQTFGLFVEALNAEPKTRDKSTALQKRLVRFQFPNVYDLDKGFEKEMRADSMLGALLALLIDHYVKPDETFKLKPTAGSTDLQVDQMLFNSMSLQYIQYASAANPKVFAALVGQDVATVVASFLPWLQNQDKNSGYTELDAQRLLADCFVLRRTKRRGVQPFNYYKIAALTDAAEALLTRPDVVEDAEEEEEIHDVLVDG